MTNYLQGLSLVSAGLASTTMVATVATLYRSRRESSRAEERLRSVSLTQSIESFDLKALRRVLYTELGEVRVSDYVSRQPLRDRFDQLIAEVADFTAKPDQESAERPHEESASVAWAGRIPEELSRPYEELIAGDVWAAMGRLRRTLEVRFEHLLGDEAPSDDRRRPAGAGQQLRLLRSSGRVDERWFESLRYVISVCNAAVHGEDVPIATAAEALDIAARWITETHNAPPR